MVKHRFLPATNTVLYAKWVPLTATVTFDSDLPQVVGVMVKRPDIVGMVKRNDVFVAFDALTTFDKGFLVARPEGSLDKKAIARLGLDWDRCIMWHGMKAVTESGKTLGFVSGAVVATLAHWFSWRKKWAFIFLW